MKGAEFLEQVARQQEEGLQRAAALESQHDMIGAVPESLRDEVIWAELLVRVDYQSGKWWLFDFEIEQWQELPFHQVSDALEGMGVEDLDWVKRLFQWRDGNAERRKHDAAEREKDRRDREREENRLIQKRKREMRGQREFAI